MHASSRDNRETRTACAGHRRPRSSPPHQPLRAITRSRDSRPSGDETSYGTDTTRPEGRASSPDVGVALAGHPLTNLGDPKELAHLASITPPINNGQGWSPP